MALKLLGSLESSGGDLQVLGTVKTSTHGDGLVFGSPTTVKFKLGVYGANDLLFKDPNNNVLMTLTAAGNVGIGTASPSSNLHVHGAGGSGVATQIKVTQADDGAGHPGAAAILQSSGWGEAFLKLSGHQISATGGDFNVTSSTDLALQTNGTNTRMFIKSGGNIGIGTTAPLEKLHVAGKINSSNNIVSNATYTMFTGRSSRTVDDYGGLNKQYFKANLVTPGPNTTGESSAHGIADLRFQLANSAGNTGMSDIMTLRSGGNVGIGTTTPSDMLHIHATGNGYKALIVEDDARRIELGRDMITAKSADGSTVQNLYIQPAGNTAFATNSGNVGIGTTSPSQKLHVAGKGLFTDFVRFNGVTAPDFPVDIDAVDGGKSLRSTRGTSVFRIDQGNDGPGYIGMQSADDFSIQTNNTSKIYITSAGNVGIGTTSPSNTLDVNGSADISGRLDVASDLRIRGNSGDIDQGVVRQYVNSSNTLFIDAGNDGNNVGQFKSDGSLILNSSNSQGLSIRQSANSGNDMQVEIRGSRNAPAAGVNPAKLILSSYDNDDGSGVVKTGAEFYMESTSLTGGDLSDFEVGLRYRKDGAVVDGISIHDGRVTAHGDLLVNNSANFNGNVEITGDTASPHSDNAFLVLRGSDGSNALRVQNSGEVVVQNNYLYAAGTGTSLYVQANAVFRGNILNDTSGAPVTISDNLVVNGNLTVDGTTTTLNTTTVEVQDNILQLNTTQGSPNTMTATTSGISVFRGLDTNGNDTITQASLIFDEGDDVWDLTNKLKVASNIYSGGNVFQIEGANPYIKGTGSGSMRIKHTAGQTMYIRPDETGQVSFFEGANSQPVYFMTQTPTVNNTTRESAQLKFQTRSKQSDGNSVSKYATIKHLTHSIGYNYTTLDFSGSDKSKFNMPIEVAGNVTLESASPVLKIDATGTGNPEIFFARITGDDQNAKIRLLNNQLAFENEGDPDSSFLFQGRAAGAGSLSDFLKIEDTGITAPGATFAGDVTIGNKAYPKINLSDNQGVARNFSVGTSNETFTVRNETGSVMFLQ